MTIRRLGLVCLLAFTCSAYAQFGKIKIPGAGKITGSRGSSGSPQVIGVEGKGKVDATREVTIKVENVSVGMMGTIKVESRRPCEVVSNSKIEDGAIKVTLKVTSEKVGDMYVSGTDRCDLSIKIFNSRLDQYPSRELYANVAVEPGDAMMEQQRKQEKQISDAQEQAAETQRKLRPHIEAQQKSAVGNKWTVRFANGKTEVWTFTGMDNMTNMANFKSNAGGEIKIMYTGMYYAIIVGECGMMGQEEGSGKISAKPKSGGKKCASTPTFTASIE